MLGHTHLHPLPGGDPGSGLVGEPSRVLAGQGNMQGDDNHAQAEGSSSTRTSPPAPSTPSPPPTSPPFSLPRPTSRFELGPPHGIRSTVPCPSAAATLQPDAASTWVDRLRAQRLSLGGPPGALDSHSFAPSCSSSSGNSGGSCGSSSGGGSGGVARVGVGDGCVCGQGDEGCARLGQELGCGAWCRQGNGGAAGPSGEGELPLDGRAQGAARPEEGEERVHAREHEVGRDDGRDWRPNMAQPFLQVAEAPAASCCMRCKQCGTARGPEPVAWPMSSKPLQAAGL